MKPFNRLEQDAHSWIDFALEMILFFVAFVLFVLMWGVSP